jgi:ADP-ribose pyrophosphatase YjhB (NUDIX family)
MAWIRHSHCSFCGTPFPAELPWPRQCTHCGQISYLNPLPVAVTLVPVGDGVLLVRRAVAPRAGQLALPGGFIDLGESWQAAGAREVQEEAGLVIDPAGIRLFTVHSAPDGTVLVFGQAESLDPADLAALPAFVPTAEASERLVVDRPVELAFPLHTQVLADYFRR